MVDMLSDAADEQQQRENAEFLLRLNKQGELPEAFWKLPKLNSVDAAETLAMCECDLVLDNLEELRADVATALAPHSEYRLYLRGLALLGAGVATALAHYEGSGLYLDGLKSLSLDDATLLSDHQSIYGEGWTLSLNGLETLSPGVAEAFSKFVGKLSLDGLTNLSDRELEALNRHEGELSLKGLRNSGKGD